MNKDTSELHPDFILMCREEIKNVKYICDVLSNLHNNEEYDVACTSLITGWVDEIESRIALGNISYKWLIKDLQSMLKEKQNALVYISKVYDKRGELSCVMK